MELQLPAYATATVTRDPSHICDLHHISQQRQLLNPLNKARDQTRNLMVPSRICFHCTAMVTPISFFSFFFFCFFILVFSRTAPTACGGSQARGLIGAVAACLHHSHSNAGSESRLQTYITAQGNAGSLTHQASPEIEPTSSWMPVRFVSTEPQGELLFHAILKHKASFNFVF